MLKSPPPARYAALLFAACIIAQTGQTQTGLAQQKSSTAARPTPAQQAGENIAAARAAMSAGVTAANSGDLTEARRQFSRAVTLAPKVSAGHAALGATLLSLGQVADAARELERARQLAPANGSEAASIDLNLADAYVALGNYPAAIRLFHEALTAAAPPAPTPQDSIAYSTALAATGDLSTAEATLRTALAAAQAVGQDSAELNDALGTILAQRGNLEPALPYFRQAVTLNPALTQAQYHLGAALLALNQPSEAIAPLQLAVAANSKSFDAQLQLGRALSVIHDDANALAALHRAAELKTPAINPDALYALAIALQASGDVTASLPIFAAAAATAKPGTEAAGSAALTNYALARVQTGDAKGALPLYARALGMGPDSATLREDYGVAYLQQSDLDHALEQFRAGLALDPANAHLHYDLALALKLKDDLAAAIPEFERAAELDPSLPDPAYTLGIIYMQQGRFPDAVKQLTRATTLQPNNGDAWALLGSVLKDAGDSANATAALKRAITLQPDQPSLHIQLATLEAQAGDKEAAAADRKIAADLSRAATSRQRASFALKSGRALLSDGKLDEAILQLTTATQAEPTLAEPHRLLSEAYARQGKSADAALERNKAAALEATQPAKN
jgi:tetratricopeptide (TPR) repeat protein